LRAYVLASGEQFYKSEPSDAVGGRELVIPSGGMFGGGSSINLGMYTRAQGSDYDDWRTPGWDARDIIPLCNKTETYHFAPASSLNPEKHGSSGPIQISDGCFRSSSEHDIIKTITRLGLKELPDVNDFETTNGFMVSNSYDNVHAAVLGR
jgi:alcohol oxidase